MGSGKGKARRAQSKASVDADIASRGVDVPDGYRQILPTIVMTGDGVATKMDMSPPPKECLISVFVNEKEDPPSLCVGYVHDHKRGEELRCEVDSGAVYPLTENGAKLGPGFAPVGRAQLFGILNEVSVAVDTQEQYGLEVAEGSHARFHHEDLERALSPVLLRKLFGTPIKMDDGDLRQVSF
jgi:hypothetical protein